MLYETWDIVWNHDCNYIDNIIDLSFEEHFHRVYEFAVVVEGEAIFYVNKTKYVLEPNDAIFIMPNQFHSLETPEHSKMIMLRFMPDFAGIFHTTYNGKIPECNKFHILPFIMEGLVKPVNIYQEKACVYQICGEFAAQNTKWTDASKEDDLLVKLLMCVEREFKNDCSLKTVSKELGYDYTYLSRFFYKSTGITFTEYLNDCRIKHAGYLIRNSKSSIMEVAHECGYNSIRSFNRNFLKHTGTTPVKYRSMTEN